MIRIIRKYRKEESRLHSGIIDKLWFEILVAGLFSQEASEKIGVPREILIDDFLSKRLSREIKRKIVDEWGKGKANEFLLELKTGNRKDGWDGNFKILGQEECEYLIQRFSNLRFKRIIEILEGEKDGKG